MTGIRKATEADGTAVAATLASAFGEDPVIRWMTGTTDTERRMMPFWRAMARLNLRKADHEVYMSDDSASVAIWQGVDKWKVPPADIIRWMPSMVSSFRARTPAALRLLTRMEKQHPSAPHYYLEFLGTRRDRQSKGTGSAVLCAMLDRCDAEGLPAYLESSNPRNVPFYARYGFKERSEIEAPKGGPKLLAMWREPRG